MTVHFLADPATEPPAIVAARVRVIRILSLLVGLMALGLWGVNYFFGGPVDTQSFLSLVLVALAAVALLLLKHGHFSVVSWMLVISLFVTGALSVFFYGSVRSVGNYLIMAGLIAAATFLSRKALFWASPGAVVLIVALGWAENQGWLFAAPSFEMSVRTWMTQVACLIVVAVMVHLGRTQVQLARDLHFDESRQRLSARLQRDHNQERFLRVFRSSPTPIYVQSARTGLILNVNPAFERVLGCDRQSVINKRDNAFWLPDRQCEAFLHRRANGLRSGWLPITGVCGDGSHVALFICSEMDKDPDDSLVITALRPRELSAASAPAGGHASMRGRPPAFLDSFSEGEDLHV